MKSRLRELALFGIAGVIGLGVDLAALYLLAPALGWYFGRALSFVAAATATWIFNRRFTFAAAQKDSVLRQWIKYLVTMLGGAMVNYSVYVMAVHVFIDDFGNAAPAIGVALGSVAGMAVNYISARRLVFRHSRSD